MIPDVPATPHHTANADQRAFCEACGSSGGAAPLLELPFPVDVLENLGLPVALPRGVRRLCAECAGKGLQGGKLDLVDLVALAPVSVKQSIHAQLIEFFEI